MPSLLPSVGSRDVQLSFTKPHHDVEWRHSFDIANWQLYYRAIPAGVSRITSTTNTTVFAKERDIRADLSDTDKYLAVFAGAFEFSVSPHARRLQNGNGSVNRSWAIRKIALGCMRTARGLLLTCMRASSHSWVIAASRCKLLQLWLVNGLILGT